MVRAPGNSENFSLHCSILLWIVQNVARFYLSRSDISHTGFFLELNQREDFLAKDIPNIPQ